MNVEIYHLAMNFDLIDSAVVNSRRNPGYNTNGSFQVLMRECVFFVPLHTLQCARGSDALLLEWTERLSVQSRPLSHVEVSLRLRINPRSLLKRLHHSKRKCTR